MTDDAAKNRDLKSRMRTYLSVLLIAAGCLQFAGYLVDSRPLRGLGMSYAVAPLPTVFSTVQGVEGFDTRIMLQVRNSEGEIEQVVFDAETFSEFRGHYFLKNAYALLLSYPHVVRPELLENALNFSLCRGDLLRNLNLPANATPVNLVIDRSFYGQPETLELAPSCLE